MTTKNNMPSDSLPVTLQEGDWQALGDIASHIRRVVFIDEQQVPQDEEWDGQDPACHHLLAYLDGNPVGTATATARWPYRPRGSACRGARNRHWRPVDGRRYRRRPARRPPPGSP